MVNVIMHGCDGAMGRVVCQHIQTEKELNIVAGVDITLDAAATFPVFERIGDCDMPADVIIDFSAAGAVPEILEHAVATKTPLIVCTTGLDEGSINRLEEISREIPVFLSVNMSLGINLLLALAKKTATILAGESFDIEIIESHHSKKANAPSGTALLLANSINDALGGEYRLESDRAQSKRQRSEKEIGVSSIRGGTIVGEHTVMFAGPDEVIELTHKAASKDVFARGAIAAAKFIVGRQPGKYGMEDLIGDF